MFRHSGTIAVRRARRKLFPITIIGALDTVPMRVAKVASQALASVAVIARHRGPRCQIDVKYWWL